MSDDVEKPSESPAERSLPTIYVKNEAGEYVPLEMEAVPGNAPRATPAGMVIVGRSERLQTSFTGPVAAPETIEGYEKFYPGAGKLLIDEHIADKRHARDIETQEVSNEKWGVVRGQVLSFLLMGGTIAGSVACALTEHTAAAVALASAPVLSALGRILGRGSAGTDAAPTNVPAISDES
ncbi:hypothetical protein ACBY01_07185 [Sphingomonas sp. ac-8]|uniref:hypothetical protein n=1 Tax=Sphingomonas sp. ac-8 TaxID=3242977 RepID=UPI003A813949